MISVMKPSWSRMQTRRSPAGPCGGVIVAAPTVGMRATTASKSSTWEGHAGVADVAGAPVEGEGARHGTGVAPDLELNEVLAVDDPPEGGGGVGNLLQGWRGNRPR